MSRGPKTPGSSSGYGASGEVPRRGGKRRRALTSEEQALWKRVTETLTPLHPAAPNPLEADPLSETALSSQQAGKPEKNPSAAPKPPRTGAAAARPPVRPPARPAPPPLAPLEPRTRRRLARGHLEVEGRIDLHGMTQAEAHGRLRAYLAGAQARGSKTVLVITGKGGGNHVGEGRGVLRRMVPQWLGLPEFRLLVTGFDEAHATHGGSGALYVRIRRRKGGGA